MSLPLLLVLGVVIYALLGLGCCIACAAGARAQPCIACAARAARAARDRAGVIVEPGPAAYGAGFAPGTTSRQEFVVTWQGAP